MIYIVFTVFASWSVISVIIKVVSFRSYLSDVGVSGFKKFFWPFFVSGTAATSGYSHLLKHLEIHEIITA